MRVSPDGQVGQHRLAGLTRGADHTSVAARRDIAARPGIGLLHLTGREDLFARHEDGADPVPAVLVGPDPGADVADRFDEMSIATGSQHPVRKVR